MIVNNRKICLLTVDTYYFNIILTYCNINYEFLVVLYIYTYTYVSYNAF